MDAPTFIFSISISTDAHLLIPPCAAFHYYFLITLGMPKSLHSVLHEALITRTLQAACCPTSQVLMLRSPAFLYLLVRLFLGFRPSNPGASQPKASGATALLEDAVRQGLSFHGNGAGRSSSDDELQYMEVDYRLLLRRAAMLLGGALLVWSMIRYLDRKPTSRLGG